MNSHQMLQKPLEEYFREEVEAQSNFYASIMPDYYASANDLSVRRQKITCLNAVLEKERERQTKKKEEFKRRWAAASKQIANVDKSIISFEKHYNEATAQQNRAHRVIARQNEIKSEKLREIAFLKKEKELLQKVLEETAQRVDNFKPVKEYLEGVKDSSQGEFKKVREILDRYHLLEGTRQGLLERDDHARELVRRRQKGLENLSTTKENEAILLSNDLFELTEEFRGFGDKLSRLNDDLVHIRTSAAERTGDIGRVRISIYNLYLQVCKKMSRPAKIPTNDTLKQLQHIRYSMIEINKLRKEVQFMFKRAKIAQEKEKEAQLQKTKFKKGKGKEKEKKVIDMYSLFRIQKKKESKKDYENRMFLKKYMNNKSQDAGSKSYYSQSHSKATTGTFQHSNITSIINRSHT